MFYMVKNMYAKLMLTDTDILVGASKKVGKWKHSFKLADTECTKIRRPNIEVHFHKMENPVNIKIENVSVFLTQDECI